MSTGGHANTEARLEYNRAACKAYRDRKRAERERKRAGGLLAPAPQRHVQRGPHTEADPPRKPQKKCQLCGGMPHARTPERRSEGKGDCGRSSKQVVAYPAGFGVPGAPVPVCRSCGLGYEPDPELKRGPLLGSSAGMALER